MVGRVRVIEEDGTDGDRPMELDPIFDTKVPPSFRSAGCVARIVVVEEDDHYRSEVKVRAFS